MPPRSLIIRKYAASTLPITENAETGPLYGIVCPILISASLAPGSYFGLPASEAVATRPTLMIAAFMAFIRKLSFIEALPCVRHRAAAPPPRPRYADQR